MRLLRSAVLSAGLVLARADDVWGEFETALNGMNVVALGDFYAPAGSDVEGALAVGGDCTLGSYSVGAELAEDGGRVDLVVGGELAFSSGTVQGSIVHGSADSTTPEVACMSEGCSVTQDAAHWAWGDVGDAMNAASSDFAALDDTGDAEDLWSTLYLTGEEADFNVFSLSAADVDAATSLHLDVPEGAFTVVNVAGASVAFEDMSWDGDFPRRQGMVVFNLFEATELTLSGVGVEGALLAPDAHLHFAGGVVHGSVVCQSMSSAAAGEEPGASTTTGQFNLPVFSLAEEGVADSEAGSPPVAVITATREGDERGLLSSANSYDTDGGYVTSWHWEIVGGPEGASITDPDNWNSYIEGISCAPVTVRLTVGDNDGLVGSAEGEIEMADDGCSDDDTVCLFGSPAADGSGECECWDPTWTRGPLCDSMCSTYCNERGMCSEDDADVCSCWNSFKWGGDVCDEPVDDECEGGRVVDGSCECWDPLYYRGDGCDESCVDYCNGRGSCSEADNAVCDCFDPVHWTGDRCDVEIPDASATDDTISCYHGAVSDAGDCECVDGWAGDDCSELVPCYHGEWVSGECECFAGWTGEECDTYDVFPSGSSGSGSSGSGSSGSGSGSSGSGSSASGSSASSTSASSSASASASAASSASASASASTSASASASASDNSASDNSASSGDGSDVPCAYGNLVDGACECVAGYFGDDCAEQCRAACNWQGTRCGADPDVCECDEGFEGDTCAEVTMSDDDCSVSGDVDLGDDSVGVDLECDADDGDIDVDVDTDSGAAGELDGEVVLSNVLITLGGATYVGDATETEWTVENVGYSYDADADETTYTYDLTVLPGADCAPCTHAGCKQESQQCKDLSHWVLALINAGALFVSATGGLQPMSGADPTTGLLGLKSDAGQAKGTTETYVVVLQGDTGLCSTYYAVKGSTYYGIGEVEGPCEPAARRRLDDDAVVAYDFAVRFASAEGVTPVLVAADATEAGCISQSYDADTGMITGTLCRAGAYFLGSVPDDTSPPADDDDSDSDEDSGMMAVALGVSGVAVVVAVAVITLSRRQRKAVQPAPPAGVLPGQ